jgi:hypothetical protein
MLEVLTPNLIIVTQNNNFYEFLEALQFHRFFHLHRNDYVQTSCRSIQTKHHFCKALSGQERSPVKVRQIFYALVIMGNNAALYRAMCRDGPAAPTLPCAAVCVAMSVLCSGPDVV